jgi:hypothetical protein
LWHVKELLLLKAVGAKHRSKFPALSLAMVTAARLMKNCLCDLKQNKTKETNKFKLLMKDL